MSCPNHGPNNPSPKPTVSPRRHPKKPSHNLSTPQLSTEPSFRLSMLHLSHILLSPHPFYMFIRPKQGIHIHKPSLPQHSNFKPCPGTRLNPRASSNSNLNPSPGSHCSLNSNPRPGPNLNPNPSPEPQPNLSLNCSPEPLPKFSLKSSPERQLKRSLNPSPGVQPKLNLNPSLEPLPKLSLNTSPGPQPNLNLTCNPGIKCSPNCRRGTLHNINSRLNTDHNPDSLSPSLGLPSPNPSPKHNHTFSGFKHSCAPSPTLSSPGLMCSTSHPTGHLPA
ncbi:uncharacterized [Lates japonicus]